MSAHGSGATLAIWIGVALAVVFGLAVAALQALNDLLTRFAVSELECGP